MHNTSGSGPKLLGLEVIRFLAAVAVLFFHYGHFGHLYPDSYKHEALPFYSMFGLLYDHGRYGVQVFWSISGYIFFWKYRDSIARGSVAGGEFFVLRFSRLYPLHFVTLITVAVLQLGFLNLNGTYFIYQDNDAFNFVLHLLMASDWGIRSSAGFNGPIWSISVEVLVYCIFFLVLRVFGTSIIWSVLIAAGCLAAVLFKMNYMVVQCALFFYVGGIIASIQPRLSAYRKPVVWASVGMLVALPLVGLVLGARLANVKPSQVILVAMPAVLLLMTWHFQAPRMLHGAIKAAGNMTYSSYLLHFPIQLAIALVATGLGLEIPYLHPLFFITFMTIVLMASRYTYMKFESPFQDLIRRHLVVRWGPATAA